MTNSMIEKAARAADPVTWEEPHHMDDGTALVRKYIEERRKRSLARVRAILTAIRIPDEAMLDATCCSGAAEDWVAMIDSILKETP